MEQGEANSFCITYEKNSFWRVRGPIMKKLQFRESCDSVFKKLYLYFLEIKFSTAFAGFQFLKVIFTNSPKIPTRVRFCR